MASSSSSSSSIDVYAVAEPDAPNTLGGIAGLGEAPHPSVLGHMVKSLMPGQDLTRVTIPPFFLEPRSLLERMADLMMHPGLLPGLGAVADPLGRMACVLRWFLSGWHYSTPGVQKPFNPIAGETFACYWQLPDGSRTQFIAEQVSHRPPLSAIYVENRPHNISISSHVWTKSQFQAPQTTKSMMDGLVVLTLTDIGEEYHMTLPTFYAHNLIVGTMRMEIGDSCSIACAKTGLRADIDFLQMTMFSSKNHKGFEARVSRFTPPPDTSAAAAAAGGSAAAKASKASSAPGEVLCTFEGVWDGVVKQVSGPSVAPLMAGCGAFAKGLDTSAGAPFLDISKLVIEPKFVLPIALQGPWESRRLWQFPTRELLVRPEVQWALVDKEKLQLEEEQRLLPCHHKDGADWETKLFHAKPGGVMDPACGKVRDPFFLFDEALLTKFAGADSAEGAKELAERNFLLKSRELPDPRGGLRGVGAVESFTDAIKTINLSQRRVADRLATQEPNA